MIFIANKYTNWYNSIIASARNRELPADTYTETHHILPRSLGGLDNPENLVRLTGREHFICHWLLVKMVRSKSTRTSMRYALYRMSHVADGTTGRYKITSRKFALIKKHLAKAARHTHLGRVDSDETRKRRSAALKGRPSPTRGTVAWNRGIPNTPETKKKISESLKGKPAWNKGLTWEEEHKQKLSQKMKGMDRPHMKKRVKCSHCDLVSTPSAVTRYHNENCPNKSKK